MSIAQTDGKVGGALTKRTPCRMAAIPCDPSDDELEALFEWGARVAREANLTQERLQAILKKVRQEFRI